MFRGTERRGGTAQINGASLRELTKIARGILQNGNTGSRVPPSCVLPIGQSVRLPPGNAVLGSETVMSLSHF